MAAGDLSITVTLDIDDGHTPVKTAGGTAGTIQPKPSTGSVSRP